MSGENVKLRHISASVAIETNRPLVDKSIIFSL
jgi:hypothetical protein